MFQILEEIKFQNVNKKGYIKLIANIRIIYKYRNIK